MAAGLTAIGSILGAVGAMKQAKASAKAEKLRQRQMNLEAMRKKREIVREGVRARSEALSTATAQGAAEGSGLQGGIAQITNQVGRNTQANEQDRTIGNKIFKANQQYANAGGLMALGQGISSLGSVFGSSNFARFTS